MASVTYFVVQPFEMTRKGLASKPALSAQSIDHARRMAIRAAEKGGAVAFSRSGDPALGEYGEPKILGVYGQVPEEALEMSAA